MAVLFTSELAFLSVKAIIFLEDGFEEMVCMGGSPEVNDHALARICHVEGGLSLRVYRANT